MNKLYAVAAFFGLVSLLGTAGAASRSSRWLSKAVGSSVCGVACLGVLALLAPYSGIVLALNWFTAFVAVVLGAPGVVTLLLLRVLLGVA